MDNIFGLQQQTADLYRQQDFISTEFKVTAKNDILQIKHLLLINNHYHL